MPHWQCHASNQQQTTDNKLLCRLQGTSLVPFTAHALNRRIPIVTKSNQYTDAPFLPPVHIPIHRCTVPSICPHNIPANVLSRCYCRRPSFGTRDWSTFCDTCFVRRSAVFPELAIFCRVKRPSAIHCCKARSRTCTCFMRPRP